MNAVHSNRIISLDVFRGLVVLAMILVNSSGAHPYSFLEHSFWNGCHFADFIFPFFIVILGMSSVLAIDTLQRKSYSTNQLMQVIAKRVGLLFILGLLLNAFPYHLFNDFAGLRLLGVLQRLAICYLFATCAHLVFRPKTQALLLIAILVIYSLLMFFWKKLGFLGDPFAIKNNAFGLLDKQLLSSSHLYRPDFDPEGLISTLPSLASVLVGNLAGYCLISKLTDLQKSQRIFIFAGILMLSGWLWGIYLPFNKSLWTSSYVLWTGGWALMFFNLCFTMIDIKALFRRWFQPLEIFGQYALSVYVLHIFFLKIQAMIHFTAQNGETINFRVYITNILFGHFSQQNAALFYALSYTLLWFVLILAVNHWKQQSIRSKQPINNLP